MTSYPLSFYAIVDGKYKRFIKSFEIDAEIKAIDYPAMVRATIAGEDVSAIVDQTLQLEIDPFATPHVPRKTKRKNTNAWKPKVYGKCS